MSIIETTAEQLYNQSPQVLCCECRQQPGDSMPTQVWYAFGEIVYCARCAQKYVVKHQSDQSPA